MFIKRRKTPVQIFTDEDSSGSLNITSMMDMFTILLLFLLQSFTATPDVVVLSDDLQLPKSALEKTPELSTSVTISAKSILLNDKVIVDVMSDGTVASKDLTHQGKVIGALATELQTAFQQGKKWEETSGQVFAPQLLIKAHAATDATLLRKVLLTGALTGFQGYRLLVIQGEQGAVQ